MTTGPENEPVDAALARVADAHAPMLATYRSILDDIAADDKPSLSGLSIAIRELNGLP